jgi:hypothetical protein
MELRNPSPQTLISGNVISRQSLSEGEFSTVDVPRATRTGLTGINSRGDIAGRYVIDGVSHGFLLVAGQITTIDYPGAVTFTSVDGINQRGDMVGRYTLDGVNHGYVLVGLRPACVAGN